MSCRTLLACRRAAMLLSIGGVLAAAALAAPPPAATPVPLDAPYRAPYVPAADAEVLQQVPAASDPKVREMQALRKALDREPGNIVVATQLARAYIDFGRQVGDAHYAGYAEAVIAPWQRQEPPPTVAMVLQAIILQYRHQFADARGLLAQALKRDPRDAQAWLTLATLDMVQGNYSAANDDCVHVAKAGGFGLGLACTGNLRSYLGQAQQSVGLLRMVDNNVPTQAAAFKAWTEGLLAESFERLGNWTEVEAHYRKALEYAPGDNFLLVAYADFLLDRNRPKEVLTLLGDYAQSDTAFLRLALAQAALASPDLPRYVWIMAARFEALTQRGSDYYGREQVRFALYLEHDPEKALELAQRNWQVQRAPWDARVLLEAARAARQPDKAAPVLSFLEETKLEDPMIEPVARELRSQLKGAATARAP